MATNVLFLNDNTHEVIVSGSHSSLSKLSISSMFIRDAMISSASHSRNIVFIFDQHMNLQNKISATWKLAWFHLRNTAKIRKYLDSASTECLIHAFKNSILDINNSLFYGVPETHPNELHIFQNTSCMLTKTLKCDHVTLISKQIHWLHISQTIIYNILKSVFKVLHGMASLYIGEMLTQK